MTEFGNKPHERGNRSRVFLSYSRQDRDFAAWLRRSLELADIEVSRDIEDTLPGEEWWRRLTELIALADTIVFVLSPRSVASKVCADEVAHARTLNKRIFPVVIEDVEWHVVPDGLAKIHSLYFTRPAERDVSLMALIEALGTDLGWIREHTRLLDRAQAWDARGRSDSELLAGTSLKDAEQWLTARPNSAEAPTNLHQDYIRASRDAERTEQERRLRQSEHHRLEVQQQRDRAERALASATRTANTLVFGLAKKLRDARGVGIDLIRDILDQARQLQKELIDSGEKDATVRRSEAACLLEMSRTLLLQGDTRGAVEVSEQAHEIVSELSSLGMDDDELLIGLSASHENLGNALIAVGRHASALQCYQRSAGLLENRAGNNDGALKSHDLMLCYEKIGDALSLLDRKDEALSYYERSIAMCESLAIRKPTDSEIKNEIAVIADKLGGLLTLAGSYEEAANNYDRAFTIARRLAEEEPSNTRWRHSLAAAHWNVARGLMTRGRYEEALTNYQRSTQILEDLVSMDPGNGIWQFDLSIAHEGEGHALLAMTRYDASLSAYQRALAIREELVIRDSQNAHWRKNCLLIQRAIGNALSISGRHKEACQMYAHALNAAERLAANHPLDRDVRFQQAFLHLKLAGAGDRPLERYKWIAAALRGAKTVTSEESSVLSEAERALARLGHQ